MLVLYYKGFLDLNLRALALPSRLALIIGACIILQGISKSFEFEGVRSAVETGFDYRGLACITKDARRRGWLRSSGLGLYHIGFLKVLNLHAFAPPPRLALIVAASRVLQEVFENSEFAGVGSGVEVGFDYGAWLACVTRDF